MLSIFRGTNHSVVYGYVIHIILSSYQIYVKLIQIIQGILLTALEEVLVSTIDCKDVAIFSTTASSESSSIWVVTKANFVASSSTFSFVTLVYILNAKSWYKWQKSLVVRKKKTANLNWVILSKKKYLQLFVGQNLLAMNRHQKASTSYVFVGST